MSTAQKNVFGIARYSKEENGSQEEILEKAGINNIIKFVKSGWNSSYTIKKIQELAGSYQNLCIAVTELDRITRQPKDFESLITFLEQKNINLTVWEVSHNKKFNITREVYEKLIKQEIYKGYMESKAKSDRAKIRATETVCLQNLKQAIAYSCLADGKVVSSAETSRILKKLGYNITDSTISLWRRKYSEITFCFWIEIENKGFNFRVPDYDTLIKNCDNDLEKAKLETEYSCIENLVIESYEKLGLTQEILNQLCSDEEKQNIVFKMEESIERGMKKMRISNEENQKDLADYLKEDFDQGNIDQAQFLNFISQIGKDGPKGSLIDYIYSLKTNGTIDFETYQYLTCQL